MDKVRINLLFPKPLAAALEKEKERTGKSISQMIRDAVEAYLKDAGV
jgi:metal-responsive CopG/Arc/MetJ family transcriptional regulator